jgi:acyl carrier protein
MNSEKIFETLNTIFRDVFDDEAITVTESTTANDIEDWDSLMQINLILAIEAIFGMKFTIAEVTGMKNVGEMAEIISARATK